MALKFILSLRGRRSRRLEGRAIVTLLLVAVIALPLMACGKRAKPDPPPGEPNVYPKAYPNPNEQ
jgi:hypothetical protein